MSRGGSRGRFRILMSRGIGPKSWCSGDTLPSDLSDDAFNITYPQTPLWTYRCLWKHYLPATSFAADKDEAYICHISFLPFINFSTSTTSNTKSVPERGISKRWSNRVYLCKRLLRISVRNWSVVIIVHLLAYSSRWKHSQYEFVNFFCFKS